MTAREQARRRQQSTQASPAGRAGAKRDVLTEQVFQEELDALPVAEAEALTEADFAERWDGARQEAEMQLNRAERRALGERPYRMAARPMASSIKTRRVK